MEKNKEFYLTRQGLAKLRQEYDKLKNTRKAKLGKGETPSVLSSEELNAEFVSFKEDLDYIDSRLGELDYILKNHQIIKPPPKKEQAKAGLGAEVTVDLDGDTDQFFLVGTLEANPSLGKISNESPVGKALLGHRAGDKVIINSPIKIVYKIKKVQYNSI